MSFSTETKNELTRINIDKKCCILSEIAGYIRMCGSVRLSGGGRVNLKLSTENPAVARLFIRRIKSYFGVNIDLVIGENSLVRRSHIYEITIDALSNAEQILRETGILRVKEGCNYFPDDIAPDSGCGQHQRSG